MKFNEHYKRSLENVKKNFPELFKQEEETIIDLLQNLHIWMDEYRNRQGVDEEGPYDFTEREDKRHKSKRHHLEGVWKATAHFCQIYGDRFAKVIYQVAKNHAIEDMGELLEAGDYKVIGFWNKYE
jgi:hypothetical protein